MPSTTTRICASRWWLSLPFVAALAAYSAVIEGGFVWDDELLIEGQPRVRSLGPVSSYFGERFWSDPLDPSDSFYRPLVTLSYALEWRLWNGSPAGFHASNLVMHLGVVAAVAALALRLGVSNAAASLAAASFAVLPRLTESVAWVSGRTDVLAALFGGWALVLYRAERKGRWRPHVCALLLLAAMLCKEVAFVLVAALVVLELAEGGRRLSSAALLRLAPSFAAAVVVLGLRLSTGSNQPPAQTLAPPWPDRVWSVLAAVGHYARMSVDALRPELQIGFVAAPSPAMIALGVVVIGALGGWTWRMRRRLEALHWAALFAALGSLALVVHLVPLHMPGLAADRFLYLPAAMGALLLASAFEALLRRRPRAVLAAGAALVALLSATTHARVGVWNDEYRLWRSAVQERHPRNSGPLLGLAGVLLDEHLPERALVHLQQQIEEERSAPQLKSWNSWAVALSQSGQHERAISVFSDLSARFPRAVRVRLNLAMANARAARWDEAEAALGSVAVDGATKMLVDAVRARVAEARRRAEAIGSASGVAAKVARAELADSLSATFDAEQAWREVLRAPEADAELRFRALGQLAFQGEPSRVKNDLEAARATLEAAPGFSELERVIGERDRLR